MGQGECLGSTYTLYEGFAGEPRSRWRNQQGPTVPGVIKDYFGNMYAPRPRWIVRARSEREAIWMVHNSVTSATRPDQLGICWDADVQADEPPPFGADTRLGFALIAWCRTPTMSWWEDRADAERSKELIDKTGCGGGCHGSHQIVSMRADEAAWSTERDRRWIGVG